MKNTKMMLLMITATMMGIYSTNTVAGIISDSMWEYPVPSWPADGQACSAQEATTDNAQTEKLAELLYFGAKNCEHMPSVHRFMETGDFPGLTAQQFKFVLNREEEGKNLIAVAQGKDCEECREFVKMVQLSTQFVEAAELLKIDHLTMRQISEDSEMNDKLDVIMGMIKARNAQK